MPPDRMKIPPGCIEFLLRDDQISNILVPVGIYEETCQ